MDRHRSAAVDRIRPVSEGDGGDGSSHRSTLKTRSRSAAGSVAVVTCRPKSGSRFRWRHVGHRLHVGRLVSG